MTYFTIHMHNLSCIMQNLTQSLCRCHTKRSLGWLVLLVFWGHLLNNGNKSLLFSTILYQLDTLQLTHTLNRKT